jgi:sugar/nucleoside kinase (ribokinase family)
VCAVGETSSVPSTDVPFDVVVVGNAGIDTNVYLGGPVDLGHETDYSVNLDGVGQAGGYSARGFARLGYRTAFLGFVGDDSMGRFLVDELAGDGVDMSHVLVDPAGTNRSVNLMSPNGGRHSFFDGKSHMTARPDLDAWRPALTGARLAHLSIPNWARHILEPARRAGAVMSVDLQDAGDPADEYRRDFVEAADVLFVSSAHLPDPRRALDALHRAGRIVVCGMGARGCAVRTDDGYREHHAANLPEPVVDSNGAGDSLAVGFLTSYFLEGRTLDDAVHRGQLAARWCCARRGSRELITRRQLDGLGDRHGQRAERATWADGRGPGGVVEG